jgi:hypothetical protein
LAVNVFCSCGVNVVEMMLSPCTFVVRVVTAVNCARTRDQR